MVRWILFLIVALGGALFIPTPRVYESDPFPPAPETISLASLGSDCYVSSARLAKVVATPDCTVRPEQGTPGFDLSNFKVTGSSAQGFDVLTGKEDVYVCTNGCEEWEAPGALVHVPAGAIEPGSPELYLGFLDNSTSEDMDVVYLVKNLQVVP